MASSTWRWLSAVSGILLFLVPVCSGQLSATFYSTSCPNLTSIVSSRVDSILASDIGLAAALLRLQFHDCFVRGCDGSVLLNSTSGSSAEKDAFPNQTLRGFVEIDLIKADLEAACPGVVSCADIVALTAEIATSKVGNVSWQVLFGRRDGVVSLASEATVSLPIPQLSFAQLVQVFAGLGLDTKDMVVLSGAHTIGRARCSQVIQRIWNFNNVMNTSDPSINATFVEFMKAICPINSPNTFIALDSTSTVFDTAFFTDVLAQKGILPSDSELINTPLGVQIINGILSNSSFATDFGASMVKMGNIQVLTGTQGEIRNNCAKIN